METQLEIYDTTLRDGSQQEGISLTVGDKLRIAALLDELGVDYIEGGWPGALPKDDEFFRRAPRELDLVEAPLWWRSAPLGGQAPRVQADAQLRAVLEPDTQWVCIVGKAWDEHVLHALRTDLDEAIAMAGETVEYLRSKGRRVLFDAEHFFDGYEANPRFVLRWHGPLWKPGRRGSSSAIPTEAPFPIRSSM